MRKLIQYFHQMSWMSKAFSSLTFIFLLGALIYSNVGVENSEVIGLFQGNFCVPPMSEKEAPIVLKSFHIAPLFASRCADGLIELDSDLDGLCDRDEAIEGTSSQNRFSKHPAISDRVWKELKPIQPGQIEKMGESCNDRDQDADLLTNCEELLLQSKRYEAMSEDQTESLYSLASLNINHPDTDADGFIDGVELRLVNRVAPFVFSNEESGVVEAESVLSHWLDANKTEGVDIVVKSTEEEPGCFSYEVFGINTWLPQLQSFNKIQDAEKNVKLDFIIYALLSSEDAPAESLFYATTIVSADLKNDKLIDSPVVNGFKFVKIQQEEE